MKLTSITDASVGKLTIASTCMRSMRSTRRSTSVNSGMARIGVTISRKRLALVFFAEKYSMPEPGAATTSKVGFGMYSEIRPRMTTFLRPSISTTRTARRTPPAGSG